jgi:hypothetical protein
MIAPLVDEIAAEYGDRLRTVRGVQWRKKAGRCALNVTVRGLLLVVGKGWLAGAGCAA